MALKFKGEGKRHIKTDEMDGARHGRLRDDLSRKRSKHDHGLSDGRHHGSNRNDRDRLDHLVQDMDISREKMQDKDFQQSVRESAREEENRGDYRKKVASQLAAQEEADVERVKAESRRRRQDILEKYKKQHNEDIDEHHGSVQIENANGRTAKVDIVHHTLLSVEQLLAKEEFGGQVACSPKTEIPSDMLCYDIFGESPVGGSRFGKSDGLAMDASGPTDNWDDAEGYYHFRIGEVLDGRYEVAFLHGKGVSSTVIRARDKKVRRGEPEKVAIKIVRNNETICKVVQKELIILNKLAGADPKNKRHCVRLLSSFEYRSHLCVVFESLHMNLREVLKTFGRNIGINLHAVQAYAKQLFISLEHLQTCGILHCDIKLDNILKIQLQRRPSREH